MAWPATFPPVSGTTKLLDYDTLIVLWKAVRNRALVAGAGGSAGWPRHVWTPDGGIVESITATGLTDSTKAWSTSPKRWVSWTTGADYDPINYDVCIGNSLDDPWKIVRVPITDNGADSLTFDDITSWVNSNSIASIASLEGKSYWIIRRAGTGYPFWHERWPLRPNDHTIYRGSVTSATTGGATVSGAGWTVNQFAGKAFFGYASGIIQRVTIASNTTDTLTWTTQSWTPGGEFEIQEGTGSFCWPGRRGDAQWAWYRGHMKAAQTHLPNDTVAAKSEPSQSVTVFLGPLAEATELDTFDIDAVVDFQDESGDRDKFFCEHMYKTFRGLQVACEELSFSFIETRRWDGTAYVDIEWDAAKHLHVMRAAGMFRSAGINYHGTYSATVDGSGDATFSVSGLPTPSPNYFYKITPSESDLILASGRASGSSLVVGGLTVGASVRAWVAKGWTRRMPKMFRYLYPRTWFEPDDDSGLVDPPTEDFPGSWHTNAASTHLVEYDDEGGIVEAVAISNGDTARWVGDRWHDLGVAGASGGASADPVNDYRVFGAARRRTAAKEAVIAGQTTGAAAAGDTTWLRTSSQDWYGTNWYTGGVLKTHMGTATGGSTTTLTDTSMSGSSFWDGTTGRWVGHCIEIEVSAGVWEPRVCTGYVAGTQTITVSPAWSATASGKAYRIREPKYELNRWKGRKLTIIDPAEPTTYTTTITGNNDTHLFFDAIADAVQSGWTFAIDNPRVGSVFTRTGGAWVIDSEPLGREPDVVERFGRFALNDYIGVHTLNDLYLAINALRALLLDASWDSRADLAVQEKNRRSGSGFDLYDGTP